LFATERGEPILDFATFHTDRMVRAEYLAQTIFRHSRHLASPRQKKPPRPSQRTKLRICVLLLFWCGMILLAIPAAITFFG